MLELASPLGPRVYQSIVSTNVTDAAGNHLASDYNWAFAILNGGPSDDDDDDGLANADELHYGTSPLVPDTDHDSGADGADRRRHRSIGSNLATATVDTRRTPVQVDLPSPESNGTSGVGVIVARPPVQIDLPSPDTAGVNSPGLYRAKPPVSVFVTNNPTAGPRAPNFKPQPTRSRSRTGGEGEDQWRAGARCG